jgi:hypothetical protein
MVAFEVSVNGKRRYVAGHPDAQMLNICVTGSRPAIAGLFGVHGLVAVPSKAEGELDTLSYPNDRLSVGDEVTIRIVEVDRADPPVKGNTGKGSVEFIADAA